MMTRAEMKELIEALADEVKSYIDERLAALPAPRDGKDGRDGVDGKDGASGVDGKDGRDGVDGKDGAPGATPDVEAFKGNVLENLKQCRESLNDAFGEGLQKVYDQLRAEIKDGAPGKDGIDGKGITVDEFLPMFEAAAAKFMLDWERSATERQERALAAIPAPKDGVDGLSIEDLAVEDDGDGNVTLRFARGELQREFKIRLGRFKDAGVYREGDAYMKGDGVSYGGSFWIAQKDAPEGRPGTVEGQWRLAVKKGRDGKDGGSSGSAPAAPVRLR